MKKFMVILLLSLCSCVRRPLSWESCDSGSALSALIPVSVDWSISGFDLDESVSRSSDDYIHRVSFRFFPLDGSEAFDRYIEDDVESGTIEVPVGSYAVVIFNESIYDSYWQEAIEFEDVDSYELFAAKIVDHDPTLYDFYTPADDENLSVEALRLASCSVAEFIVTEAMCNLDSVSWAESDQQMALRLNPVAPRPLTLTTTIEIETENLSSASTVTASLTGLSQRVFMASGDTDSITTTHIGELTQISWNDSDQLHGVISEEFLTFSIPSSTSTHTLTLDVILTTGSRHSPEQEMVYDVSDQILSATTRYAENDLSASVSLSLPEVSEDVEVSDWGDPTIIVIQ